MDTGSTCVPVLAYHNVSGGTIDSDDHLTLSESLFAEHLAALSESGWHTGFVRDIPETPASGGPPVFLTFDDAYETFESMVLPNLRTAGARATVFVPTAYLGRAATWPGNGTGASLRIIGTSSLRDLDPAWVEVGSHGHRHLQSDLLTRLRLHDEFETSRQVLQGILGYPITSLAYPFGYNTRRVRATAREAGYTRACEVGLGLHELGRGRELRIRRLLMTRDVTPERLIHLLRNGQRTAWQAAFYRLGRPAWRQVRRARAMLNRPGAPDGADRTAGTS